MSWIQNIKRAAWLLLAGLTGTAVAFSAPREQIGASKTLMQQVEGNAELELWSAAPGLEGAAALFKAQTPNVKVKVRTFNSGAELYRTLQTALKTGEGAPDVARVEYAFMPWLLQTKGLLELNAGGAQGLFVPWAWSQTTSDQVTYGIPQDSGALSLVFREDIFERYNLAVPRTWAEFARVGTELKERTKGQVKLANFDRSSLFFAALVWAQGGQLWQKDDSAFEQTLNTMASRQVATFWGNLIRQGVVTTTDEYSASHWNALRSGRVAAAIAPAWAIGAFSRNLAPAASKGAKYRLAQLPRVSASVDTSGNWGGSGLIVSRSTKYPQAATSFALFAATSNNATAKFWLEESRFPALLNVLELPEVLDPAQQRNAFFGGNATRVYAAASSFVPTRFDWAPWLPMADGVYRKLLTDALAKKISFTQMMEQWQQQTLELARRAGHAVR
jgi:multiple sugar transport system substrate-binding protein